MKELKYFIAFASGVVIGSLATYKALDKKYEKRAEEEINSVKERFSRMKHKGSHSKEDLKEKNKMLEQNSSIISSQGYDMNENGTVDYSNISRPKRKDIIYEDEENTDIFIIDPDEFGEEENIECATLYYYADGVLADENDIPVNNLEDTIVTDFANHFGEYEEDSVYVRNLKLKLDFEILREEQSFSELFGEQ